MGGKKLLKELGVLITYINMRSTMYYVIWSFFEEGISLKYDEIQDIMSKWLDEVYNLRGITTLFGEKGIKSLVG